jgi:hypothetical protein
MKTRILTLVALAGMMGVSQATMAQDAGTTVVRPGTTDVIKATIFSGHWVTVAVVGDGDTDLDLYVYDPYGRLVGYDDDPTDACLVQFNPRYTGTYTIKVVNRSNFMANRYAIGID